MSVQRRGRNAQTVTIYRTVTITDDRGNEQQRADLSNGIVEKASITRSKTARLEVPGQLGVEVFTMTVRPDADVTGWTLVQWNGELWDVSEPPRFHHGTRQVRHWSVEIRRRPL